MKHEIFHFGLDHIRLNLSTKGFYPMIDNLFLGLSVALFAIGVIYDHQQFRIQKSVVILILTLGFIFFAVTLIFPGLFFVFIVYEALTMLFEGRLPDFIL